MRRTIFVLSMVMGVAMIICADDYMTKANLSKTILFLLVGLSQFLVASIQIDFKQEQEEDEE